MNNWKVHPDGNVYDGEWQLLRDDPELGIRKWIMAVDENNMVVRTDTYLPSMVAEANSETLKAAEGQKWGDGQIAARVPLSIWYRDLAEAKRQGDEDYVKKYLNRSENAWMRTFKGNL